jgi:hypothetical protein
VALRPTGTRRPQVDARSRRRVTVIGIARDGQIEKKKTWFVKRKRRPSLSGRPRNCRLSGFRVFPASRSRPRPTRKFVWAPRGRISPWRSLAFPFGWEERGRPALRQYKDSPSMSAEQGLAAAAWLGLVGLHIAGLNGLALSPGSEYLLARTVPPPICPEIAGNLRAACREQVNSHAFCVRITHRNIPTPATKRSLSAVPGSLAQ